MQEENQVVTAPVDTRDNQSTDTMEVETNIEVTPETGVEDKSSKKPAQADAPKEAETQEQKKTRSEKRKAEKDRLIRDAAEAKAENTFLKKQIDEKNAPANKQTVAEPRDLTKKPDIKDYSNDQYLEYVEDLGKFNANQILTERETKAAESRRTEDLQTFAQDVQQTNPDIIPKIDEYYKAGLITPEIENGFLASTMRKELLEHLVKFPGDLQQLRAYRPEAIPAAMKQIEAFIKKGGMSEAAEEPRQTKAGAPIAPPGNNAKTDRSINSYSQEEIENMPLSEYRQRFMKNK